MHKVANEEEKDIDNLQRIIEHVNKYKKLKNIDCENEETKIYNECIADKSISSYIWSSVYDICKKDTVGKKYDECLATKKINEQNYDTNMNQLNIIFTENKNIINKKQEQIKKQINEMNQRKKLLNDIYQCMDDEYKNIGIMIKGQNKTVSKSINRFIVLQMMVNKFLEDEYELYGKIFNEEILKL